MTIRLLAGDARDVLPTLPAESVQCVVTSPPYYGLRDYGTALWDGGDAACSHLRNVPQRDASSSTLTATGGPSGQWPHLPFRDTCGKCGAVRVDRQIGLERSPETYLATMVGVFREVRRVLRRDGTCWVNMGDSYVAGRGLDKDRNPRSPGIMRSHNSGDWIHSANKVLDDPIQGRGVGMGLKPKDLLLMPARLALALQADGWWVRSAIVWAKPNPMPESVTDRPTSAYEMVYLLTRSARYFYDADAVREEADPSTQRSTPALNVTEAIGNTGGNKRTDFEKNRHVVYSRKLRNVWTIATHAYPDAHFATFPPELAERCIRAGTSERGCCAACGKPWVRVVERGEPDLAHQRACGGDRHGEYHGSATKDYAAAGVQDASAVKADILARMVKKTTTGWSPGCRCRVLCIECKGTGYAEPASTFNFDNDCPVCKGDGWVVPPPVPCTVLDPFIGAGTTALVADRLQRDCIGIDLNTQYTRMAMDRCIADAPLFTSFPPAEDPEETRMADLFTDMAAD